MIFTRSIRGDIVIGRCVKLKKRKPAIHMNCRFKADSMRLKWVTSLSLVYFRYKENLQLIRIAGLWWTIQDSNLWPPARQADALPAAPIVQLSNSSFILPQEAENVNTFFIFFAASKLKISKNRLPEIGESVDRFLAVLNGSRSSARSYSQTPGR